jgi:hypothetical protein
MLTGLPRNQPARNSNPSASLLNYSQDNYYMAQLTSNTDSIIKKLVTVFAISSCFQDSFVTGDNPVRAATVNKITIPGYLTNSQPALYRDTHIIPKSYVPGLQKHVPYPPFPASKAYCSNTGIGFTAGMRRVTLSNYTAGPL